ncbi:MAG: DUF3786 domain-containing protein [Planctomycetota bacterium]|jgi:hypothetical protein
MQIELNARSTETLVEKADRKIKELQEQIRRTDLAGAAKRIGAPYNRGRLTVYCLGKAFAVDALGRIWTELHVNPWIAVPVLNYILRGGASEPIGEWIPFRELPRGKTWAALFAQRFIAPCKRVADVNPKFFDDLMRLLGGKPAKDFIASDISLVLKPLPRLPLLLSYWKPDEDFPSDLHVFFDRTAEKNLDIDLIHMMSTGLASMFEKIARNHGHRL